MKLSDPILLKMKHIHRPYAPYTFLKQAYCEALSKGEYTIQEHEHQNKEKTGPEDAIKLYIELKHRGVLKYKYECVGSSLKKGRPKLALGILI